MFKIWRSSLNRLQSQFHYQVFSLNFLLRALLLVHANRTIICFIFTCQNIEKKTNFSERHDHKSKRKTVTNNHESAIFSWFLVLRHMAPSRAQQWPEIATKSHSISRERTDALIVYPVHAFSRMKNARLTKRTVAVLPSHHHLARPGKTPPSLCPAFFSIDRICQFTKDCGAPDRKQSFWDKWNFCRTLFRGENIWLGPNKGA